MKKIFGRKKILIPVLLVCSVAFIAGVPLNDNKTVLEQIAAAFPSGDADLPRQEQARKTLDDVWEEVQKISDHNAGDSLTLTGTIRLYDNADEYGIKEQQNFTMQQAGSNQWLRLDSFDRIQLYDNLVMLDHSEKEIVSQYTGQTDSLLAAFKLMDRAKLKEILIKDGTTAEIITEDGFKVLHITPGSMDAVNEYHIYYDPVTYEIKKFKLAYTSFPYQDYMQNDDRYAAAGGKAAQEEAEAGDTATADDDEPEIEDLNITEYVIEFNITGTERACAFNFLDNQFFSVKPDYNLDFKGKLAAYKKIKF